MDDKTREIERLAQTINVVKDKKEDEIWQAMLKEEREEKEWQQMLLEEKAEKEEKKKAEPKTVDKRIDVFEETKSLRVSFWIGVGILSLTALLSIIMIIFPQAFFANFNVYSREMAIGFRLIAVVMLLLSVVFGCVAISQYKRYKHLAGNFNLFYLISLIIGVALIVNNYFSVVAKDGAILPLFGELSQGYAFLFVWLPLVGFIANTVCNFCSKLVSLKAEKGIQKLLLIVLFGMFVFVMFSSPILEARMLNKTYYLYSVGSLENENAFVQVGEGKIEIADTQNSDIGLFMGDEEGFERVVVGLIIVFPILFFIVIIIFIFLALFECGRMNTNTLKKLIKTKGKQASKRNIMDCLNNDSIEDPNVIEPNARVSGFNLELFLPLLYNVIILVVNNFREGQIPIPNIPWNIVIIAVLLCVGYYYIGKIIDKKITKSMKKSLNALFA